MLRAFSSVARYPYDSTPLSILTLSRCSSKAAMSKQPKAVIFDMGGVIVPSAIKIFTEFENLAKLPNGMLNRLVVNGGMDGPWSLLESGKLNLKQFASAFGQEISKQVGRDVDVSSMVAKMGLVETYHSSPVMIDAIKCLRSEGFKTALLTNNWFLDELQTETVLPVDRSLFDVIVESCVSGCRKPDKVIYRQCIQELGVSADEAVFLDDIGSNLKAARELGITTIKVTSPEQGVVDLEQVLNIPLRGFVPGTRSVPKHLMLDVNSLEQYLKSLGMQDHSQPNVRMFEHGQSNPTYFVSYAGRNMVLRKKPPGELLPSAHAVDREYKVMSALSQVGIPVPNMIAFCSDDSVLGTQFYLMDFVNGHILKDIRLQHLPKTSKREIIMAFIRVLVQIHAVDISKVGLSNYGKKEKFMERNFRRFASQYELCKTHDIPSMTKLMEWLPKHMPDNERVTIVHGDFRLDNVIFHPERPEVIAVLDWELSTLGDPLTDLATVVSTYYLPVSCPFQIGLKGLDIEDLGLPSVDEIVTEYFRLSNLPAINNFSFYIAFSMFRMASILQGVYKRSMAGQSSSSNGKIVGEFAAEMANIGWEVASKSNLNKTVSIGALHTSAKTISQKEQIFKSQSQQSVKPVLSQSFSTDTNTVGQAVKMAVTVEGLSPRIQDLHRQLKAFIHEHVLPLETLHKKRLREGINRWEIMPELEEAKVKAKASGLWNLFLPIESDPEVKYGAGLTNLEYAFLCEEMGKCLLAPEIFNCSAPDTGNMEVLVRYGTEEQKEKFLKPLLDGKIRSCFAMTEPAVASSDATNIQSSIHKDGDFYIVNGHKWWTSGALDPRCKICIFMGKTDIGAAKHRQQSMILVPMDSPGIRVIRPLTVLGFDDAPEGHGEVVFNNVRVPASNILLGEGRGFEIAQGRLGPGRIHHCMRLIGNAERALELMLNRTVNRIAFGKPLADQGSIQEDVAKSRIEIEQCRLLVLKAACIMDLYGNKVAAPEIAMIKVAVPNMALAVIDRAIQAFGGAGLNDDLPLAHMFAYARSLRLADGPDQVHMRAIAKMEYAKSITARL